MISLEMDSEYMSKADLMAHLKVRRMIVDRLIKEGLPHIRFGRKFLFRKIDVDRFMESKVVKRPA